MSTALVSKTPLRQVTTVRELLSNAQAGEQLAAVPAIRPDLAIIHAQRADHAGNVLIEGITGVQKEVVLAARQALVTVEEIVDDLRAPSPNSCILPHWTVSAIAVVPGSPGSELVA